MTDATHQRLLRTLAILAIVLGVTARVIDFGITPPGLNQDEASIGYESWSLLRHGIDRNGASWPVHLVSWGSGQNALYAYVTMPFVAFGLTPLTTRLPMLLSALLSLPLVWWIARRLFDEAAAWAATALVALSPWHIMLSRWGLESNVLPFVFLSALACFVAPLPKGEELGAGAGHRKQTMWLMAACALFGLCLYTYGSAYLAIPIFLVMALAVGIVKRAITIRAALIGFLVFMILVLPIALFVAVNTLKWDTLVILGVTIPRLPATPRFQSQLAQGPLAHAGLLWQLLLTQRDGTLYNVTDPYGVVYSAVFFALAIGLVVVTIVFVVRRRWPAHRALVALWIVACVPTGLVQEPNINRVNLLLMGLVFAGGTALSAIDARLRGATAAGLVAMLILFGLFARDYFTTQRIKLAPEFFDGLIPAIQHAQASTSTNDLICITDKANMPYIYVLFAEHADPREFNRTVQYVDATAAFREVASFGRYTFGLERCDFATARAIVTRNDERLPDGLRADKASFAFFDAYLIK